LVPWFPRRDLSKASFIRKKLPKAYAVIGRRRFGPTVILNPHHSLPYDAVGQ